MHLNSNTVINNKQQPITNTNTTFMLTKSRFKTLIDEIQHKLTHHHQHSLRSLHNQHSPRSLHNNKSSHHNRPLQKTSILPQFYNKNRIKHNRQSKLNQNRISINLQFNKLILNKKNLFVQHSPNSQDLFNYLPSIQSSQSKNININNDNENSIDLNMRKSSLRWKINPKIKQNNQTFLLTSSSYLNHHINTKNNDNNELSQQIRRNRKFKKLSNLNSINKHHNKNNKSQLSQPQQQQSLINHYNINNNKGSEYQLSNNKDKTKCETEMTEQQLSSCRQNTNYSPTNKQQQNIHYQLRHSKTKTYNQ